MGTKGWIIFSAIVVVVLGGLVYFSGQNKLDVSGYDLGKIITTNEDNGQIGDHVYGNKDSDIVFIEYGDFQCNPGCRLFHEHFAPIMDEPKYMDKIAFVFRNYPMPELHPHALAAATTAETAGVQGKFWEMWDILYTNQEKWSGVSADERGDVFESYAREAGLDIDKYHEDLTSDAVANKIRFDRATGSRLKISGTPSLYLNGKQVDGEKIASTDSIRALLDDAIAQKK